MRLRPHGGTTPWHAPNLAVYFWIPVGSCGLELVYPYTVLQSPSVYFWQDSSGEYASGGLIALLMKLQHGVLSPTCSRALHSGPDAEYR